LSAVCLVSLLFLNSVFAGSTGLLVFVFSAR